MTNEIVLNGDPETPTVSDVSDASKSLDIVQDTLDSFMSAADVTAVYDEPIQSGEHIVIPAAEVVGVMGFGVGSGSSDEKENASGGGGGGGGSVLARPVAAIVIAPNGVRVEPIVDVTKLALAALTAAGFMLGMVARMNRRKFTVPKA